MKYIHTGDRLAHTLAEPTFLNSPRRPLDTMVIEKGKFKGETVIELILKLIKLVSPGQEFTYIAHNGRSFRYGGSPKKLQGWDITRKQDLSICTELNTAQEIEISKLLCPLALCVCFLDLTFSIKVIKEPRADRLDLGFLEPEECTILLSGLLLEDHWDRITKLFAVFSDITYDTLEGDDHPMHFSSTEVSAYIHQDTMKIEELKVGDVVESDRVHY